VIVTAAFGSPFITASAKAFKSAIFLHLSNVLIGPKFRYFQNPLLLNTIPAPKASDKSALLPPN
jgi:hypothetical protein